MADDVLRCRSMMEGDVQRDMDLIRALMLKLEAVKLPYRGMKIIDPTSSDVAVPPYGFEEIGYHLDQIEQAGFLQPVAHRAARGLVFTGLSPAGHEFIDSVRNADAWAATKERAGTIGNFTLSFVTDLAKAWAKAKAAEHGWM